jgi:hypothetical protein
MLRRCAMQVVPFAQRRRVSRPKLSLPAKNAVVFRKGIEMQNVAQILKRLTDLETRVAALDGKSAGQATPSAPKPIEDEGMRVIYLAPETSFVMPSPDELKQLFVISGARMAQLGRTPKFSGPRAEENKAEYFPQFCRAFEALGYITRADDLDKKHSASFWSARAEDVLRARGDGSVEVGPAFFQAVVAHNDIPFNDSREFPYVQEFGLRDYQIGSPATDKWRGVLAAGSTRAPIVVRDPSGPASPAFVRAG